MVKNDAQNYEHFAQYYGKLLRYHHFHCGFLWGSELYTIYGLLSWSHDFRRWLWMLWMLWVKALVVHHQNSRYHLVPSGTSRSACSSPDDFQTMKWNVSFTCWPILLWSFLVSHHPTMVIGCFTLKLGWTQLKRDEAPEHMIDWTD